MTGVQTCALPIYQSRSVLIHSVLPEEPPLAALKPSDIFATVSPAVVLVEALDANDYLLGLGSGFIVRSDGRIVTNFHVIEKAHSLRITTADGQVFSVTAVMSKGIDRDLAVLQIDGLGLPIVQLGNSSEVSTGARVFAIGNPLGLQNTLSEGLVSNHQRMFDGQSYLQISVPISPGSSGGVLVNELGEVIGVTVGGFAMGQNLNLAIPINDVRSMLESAEENTAISTVYPVEGVTLQETLRLLVGDTRKLVATVIPSYAFSGALTWMTSNASVASVDAAGLVSGKSLGTAQITVTTVDGGKQAICTVTVVSSTGEGAYVLDSTMGNTQGNSGNGGTVVQKEGWLYYYTWDYLADGKHGALVRERLDGTGRTVIVREVSSNINVVGDWVYYINHNDSMTLYKVRTDGSGRTKLNDDTCRNVVVSGDCIYYINFGDNHRLYKIYTDGEGREPITKERCPGGFVVADGWIYYDSAGISFDIRQGLRKMRSDGTDNTLLDWSRSSGLNIAGDRKSVV